MHKNKNTAPESISNEFKYTITFTDSTTNATQQGQTQKHCREQCFCVC